MPSLKVFTEEDRKMRLPWWGVLGIILGGLPVLILFDHFGKFNLARPTLTSAVILVIAIALRWKLNEAEVRELEALATKRSQTQAELIRGLILREIEQSKTRHRASAEMVEITACRLLLTHLLRPGATGQPMTEQAFDGLLEEVKKHKARVAEDRLKDYEAGR